MGLSFDLIIDAPIWGDEARWEQVFLPVLRKIEHHVPHPGDMELSVLLADDAVLLKLNAQWRGKDTPTNVLSFPASSAAQAAGQLGDLALSFDTLKREADAQSKNLNHHASHLFLHGVLHLLGFDHETPEQAAAMEGLEQKILLELGQPDPYEGEVQGGTETES